MGEIPIRTGSFPEEDAWQALSIVTCWYDHMQGCWNHRHLHRCGPNNFPSVRATDYSHLEHLSSYWARSLYKGWTPVGLREHQHNGNFFQLPGRDDARFQDPVVWFYVWTPFEVEEPIMLALTPCTFRCPTSGIPRPSCDHSERRSR